MLFRVIFQHVTTVALFQNKITDADWPWEQIYFYFVSCTETINLQFTNNWPGLWSKWFTAQDEGLQFNPPDPHMYYQKLQQSGFTRFVFSGIQFFCKSAATENSPSKHKFTKSTEKTDFLMLNKNKQGKPQCAQLIIIPYLVQRTFTAEDATGQ